MKAINNEYNVELSKAIEELFFRDILYVFDNFNKEFAKVFF